MAVYWLSLDIYNQFSISKPVQPQTELKDDMRVSRCTLLLLLLFQKSLRTTFKAISTLVASRLNVVALWFC